MGKFVKVVLFFAIGGLLMACSQQLPAQSNASEIAVGMSQEEVRLILGTPTETTGDSRGVETCENFAYQDQGNTLYIHVRYRGGAVKSIFDNRPHICGLTDMIGELQVVE